MKHKSSEVYKNLRIAEILVNGKVKTKDGKFTFREGLVEKEIKADFEHVLRSVNSWPFGVLHAEKDLVGKRHVTIRCEDDPEWCGCLAEFAVNGPIAVMVDGESRMAKFQVGQFVDIVATDGYVKLVRILDHIPEIFKK